MSKYNLMDIFEQYQIGSGWTNDFDYEGMLNAGLKIDTDTPIEVILTDPFPIRWHNAKSIAFDNSNNMYVTFSGFTNSCEDMTKGYVYRAGAPLS